MVKERESLNLDEQIDLEELTGAKHGNSVVSKAQIEDIATKTGFINRDPIKKKERKRSPYVIQHNSKMRIGMKELLGDLTRAIGASSDQETLEKAILALIEGNKLEELKQEYKELTK